MKFLKADDHHHSFKCPGCRGPHTIPTSGPNAWGFNGEVDRPTTTPSILVNRGRLNKTEHICHSFVVNGMIQFLSDCTHALAGQTVELPDVTCEADLFWPINEL